ncbi:MAG: nucleotidyl transferase AbiEii/AbiGii toxin family protein, partial [Oligoflexia bacterium]|nr:nucleotidyl transferase AbiEii/AbiGii toxin family protein [Oligoflexia bacterium]
ALRLIHGLKSRLSRDSDFSFHDKIEKEEVFFKYLESAIRKEFSKSKLYIIDFKPTRKPKIKKTGAPDFWGGWAVEFKLITKEQLNLPEARRSSSAIVPEGFLTNKIPIDINEMEYCEGIETIKVKSIKIKVYSKPLLVLEKLRAICQSHPDYKYRITQSNRARDFYDIEQIYTKVLNEGEIDNFFKELSKHIVKVFEAKSVPLSLIDSCLRSDDFLKSQEIGWQEVESTVKGLNQNFSYYVQTVKDIVRKINL